VDCCSKVLNIVVDGFADRMPLYVPMGKSRFPAWKREEITEFSQLVQRDEL
jgi:hypothetical protein